MVPPAFILSNIGPLNALTGVPGLLTVRRPLRRMMPQSEAVGVEWMDLTYLLASTADFLKSETHPYSELEIIIQGRRG